MNDVFKAIIETIDCGEKAAMATIVSSKGSLPMSKKAKMLVRQDGSFVGTVGGGCLEADVWAEARSVMARGVPTLHRFILTEKHAGEEGLNCGGNVEIFIEPILSGVVHEVFIALKEVQDARRTGFLATVVDGGAHTAGNKMLISEGVSVGTLGDTTLDERIKRETDIIIHEDLLKVFMLDHDGVPTRVFVESILPAPRLVLFGGGHVSRAIARIAHTVGFRIIVVDDRPSFASSERFPEAEETLVAPFEGIVERVHIDPSTYLVAVTRGHQWDETVIRQVVWTDARYIGMIGSRRKIALMWKKLESEGIPGRLLERIHAPIGLEIHADTPEEIAVSVVAQLIQTRRAGGKPAHVTDTQPKQQTVDIGSNTATL